MGSGLKPTNRHNTPPGKRVPKSLRDGEVKVCRSLKDADAIIRAAYKAGEEDTPDIARLRDIRNRVLATWLHINSQTRPARHSSARILAGARLLEAIMSDIGGPGSSASGLQDHQAWLEANRSEDKS